MSWLPGNCLLKKFIHELFPVAKLRCARELRSRGLLHETQKAVETQQAVFPRPANAAVDHPKSIMQAPYAIANR